METARTLLSALFLALPGPSQEPVLVPAGEPGGRRSLAEPSADYSVHEWGTFTSVLDPAGRTLVWNPFQFFVPLPGFVQRSGEALKPSFFGSVRMETPVLYFHAQEQLRLQARVGFPDGHLTEWYPPAALGGEHEDVLVWRDVEVLPGQEPALATTLDGEHYYAARGVAAATVRAEGVAEKFLFYRGVGRFEQPLAVRVRKEDGRRVLELENRGEEPLGPVLVYENVDGEGAWLEAGALAPGAVRRLVGEAPGRTRELSLAPLEALLRAGGLCADEARAMLATWRGDWFEPGLRVLYVLPRPATDRLLPLQLVPAPRALERVLVGRLELFEPELEAELLAAARALSRGEKAVEEAFAPFGRRLSRFSLALLQARAAEEPELERAQWPLVQWLARR